MRQPIFLRISAPYFFKYVLWCNYVSYMIWTFSALCHPQRTHVIISSHRALSLVCHMTLSNETSETIPCADLIPLSTWMLAIEDLLFFLKQMHECNRYQTKLQQYHLFFRNLLLYIYPLKIFEDIRKPTIRTFFFINTRNILIYIIIY